MMKKLLITSVVRDSDKLDILKILTDEFNRESKSIKHHLPETNTYTKEIAEAVINGEMISYTERKCYNDMKITILGWMFDLSFKYSYSEVLKKGYIEKICKTLPQDSTISKLHQTISHYTVEQAQNNHFCKSHLKSIIAGKAPIVC
jgi:hypothetical protein